MRSDVDEKFRISKRTNCSPCLEWEEVYNGLYCVGVLCSCKSSSSSRKKEFENENGVRKGYIVVSKRREKNVYGMVVGASE